MLVLKALALYSLCHVLPNKPHELLNNILVATNKLHVGILVSIRCVIIIPIVVFIINIINKDLK